VSVSRTGDARRLLNSLRSRSTTSAQGIRFAVSGGAVAALYLTVTAVGADVVGLPFQAALVIGFLCGIAAHFTLQRIFVWADDRGFALGVKSQLGRYLAVAALQYAVTAVVTRVVPAALEVPVTPVYFVTALTLAALNFVVFRTRIFHVLTHADGPE
jgi:putative flippase GtrA